MRSLNNSGPLIPLLLYLGYPIARPENLYDYVIAQQGIIKRAETKWASADALLAPISETLIGLQLQEYPLREMRLKPPRIPVDLLRQVVEHAQRSLTAELMYHFRYTAAAGWKLTYPQQEQSKVRVGYQEKDQSNIVMELHSHNTMNAYFSPTDDGDELGGRFYAVIGCLDQSNPQIVIRLGMFGHWIYNVPPAVLFDGEIEPLRPAYLETRTPVYHQGSGPTCLGRVKNFFRRATL